MFYPGKVQYALSMLNEWSVYSPSILQAEPLRSFGLVTEFLRSYLPGREKSDFDQGKDQTGDIPYGNELMAVDSICDHHATVDCAMGARGTALVLPR